MTASPETVYAADYKKPAYQISRVDITFDLGLNHTEITAEMRVRREPDTAAGTPLCLDGDEDRLRETAAVLRQENTVNQPLPTAPSI